VGGRKKGRVFFVVDERRQEVMGAIAYHLPRRQDQPLLVLAWAVRTDSDELTREALVLVYLAKRYIHALARKMHHPPHVDFVADDRTMAADLRLLGFPELPPGNERRPHEVRFRQLED
jgi:hypothetical protein